MAFIYVNLFMYVSLSICFVIHFYIVS